MIVITTPTGMIGSQVLDLVTAGDEPVRVIVRDPERLAPEIRDRVDVVAGSHGDAAVVDRAFAGADGVFWLAPPDPQAETLDAVYADFSRPACEAFVHHGVRHVVGVSALGRGTTQPAGLVTATLRMDDLIASTGAGYRALTMPSFMDNTLRQIEPIRTEGLFFSTVDPDRRLPTCATLDIAAAAARLLLDRSWSGNAEVPVLGPEDLSHDEMAQIMSDVLGTTVRYRQVPIDAFGQQLVQRGQSDAWVRGMAEMMEAKNAGLDNAAPRTPASSTPTSFRQWCEEVLRPAFRRTRRA
jgi:uncharacterized protein YbjT (DUF2867 family)